MSKLIFYLYSAGGGTEVKLDSDGEDDAGEPAKVDQPVEEEPDKQEDVPEIPTLSATEEKPKLDVSQTSASAPSSVKVTSTRTSSKNSNDEKVVLYFIILQLHSFK